MARPRTMTTAAAAAILRKVMRDRGQAPTVLEFTKALGVGSTRTTLRYLQRMEDAGYIRRWEGARGIVLCDRIAALLGPGATFADRLRAGRLAAGLTLRDVEAKTGISNATVSQLETGRTANPSARVLWALALAYELEPLALLRCLCEGEQP